jgi:putative acetyltransferase
MTVTIAAESPLQDDVRVLIRELNETLDALTPVEFNFPMTVEEMAEPDTTVFVARENGAAVGCGALKRHAGGIGEVKRMYTQPNLQGRGIAGQILARVEELAREEGLAQLVLETGDGYHAARRLYERGGFARCGAVLDYPDSGYSVFFEKRLASGVDAA